MTTTAPEIQRRIDELEAQIAAAEDEAQAHYEREEELAYWRHQLELAIAREKEEKQEYSQDFGMGM